MSKTVDIGFAMNYQYVNMLDGTPLDDEPTWLFMGPGITDITQSKSEKIESTDDYSTGGTTVDTVTAIDKTTNVSGKRRYGDPLQDFVAGLEEVVGEERNTTYRVVYPDGRIIEEPVTLENISMGGPSGTSSDKQDCSFDMKRRDTPEIIRPPLGTHLPASVAVEDVAVAVGGTAEVKPSVEPATASDWCLYAVENPEVASVTADGIVTGLKAGKTRLSVKCAAKPAVRATVAVEVTGA